MEMIKKYIKQNYKTQKNAAVAWGVSPQNVNRWLSGKPKPSFKFRARIEKVTNGGILMSDWDKK